MLVMIKPEYIWLFAAIVLFIIEAISVNLITIWLGFGSLAAMVSAVFGASPLLQIAIFVSVFLLLTVFVRPSALRRLKKTTVNLASCVGKSAIVVEKIDNIEMTGKIKIDGNVLPARSDSGLIIKEREVVDIRSVSDNTLIVKIKGM